jgi:hypothetical protein
MGEREGMTPSVLFNSYRRSSRSSSTPLAETSSESDDPPVKLPPGRLLSVVLPVGDSPEFRSLLHDLLLAVWSRAEALRLPLKSLGDPATLALRLAHELDANRSFASFVGLVGVFARKHDMSGELCSSLQHPG